MPRISKYAKDGGADAAAFRVPRDSRPHGNSPNRPFAAVSVRQQTPEEGRLFEKALHVLLSELVREQLHGEKERKCETKN
jgi:hypothetical protein